MCLQFLVYLWVYLVYLRVYPVMSWKKRRKNTALYYERLSAIIFELRASTH